jgi:hypothetical protein
MATVDRRDLMSVAQVAVLLNVSQGCVVRRLLRTHAFRPVVVVGGHWYVLRANAEAYRRKQCRVASRALWELARISQEAGLYEKTDARI